MTDTFFYLVSARWFQLMVVGFALMTLITVASQWRRWREARAERRLRDDLQATYARELELIRLQDSADPESYDMAEFPTIETRHFENAIAS